MTLHFDGVNPDAVAAFVDRYGPVLALDIGSGTQDALLALPGVAPENRPRFILPAPAQRLARRVEVCTAAGRDLYLYGTIMGGGFGDAIRRHLDAGLAVTASPEAAATLHDNPERVRAMGVGSEAARSERAISVPLADYEPGFWETLLAAAGLPAPALVVAAAQDHGFHPGSDGTGNREGRFAEWRRLLESTDGDPTRWIYDIPPAPLTRLAALAARTGGPVADTGTAAVLGALAVPEVRTRSRQQGVTVINMGNSHILAFLVYRERVFGIYEHHTADRETPDLLHDLKEFRLGWLPDEQVRASGGHGCALLSPLPPEAEGFAPTFVLGPRRDRLRGEGRFVAPYGDMMFAGCHGLLRGLALRAASTC